MSLDIFERNNTIKVEVDFKVGTTLTDPSGNKAWLHVFRPDATYLYSGVAATRDGVGEYSYYISSNTTDLLGIYVVVWKGYHDVGGSQGNMPIIQREAFNLVSVEQE